uniref:Uncharacterized protein n=1 Tax=Lygus hesperus TaxID=30085 RepID=A0A0A9WYX5_LYGHE
MESYGRIRLNIFNWLPRGLGDRMSEMLARNTQDRIQDTVTKSIVKTVENMTAIYDPCVAFPAMGRLKELQRRDDPFEEPEEDPLLAAVVQEEDAGNVQTPDQGTILPDEPQRPSSDQTVSTTSSNGGSEEKYEYDAEMRSSEQNKIHEETANNDATACSKFDPTEAPTPHDFYEMIRKQAVANDGLETILRSLERNPGIKHNPESGILEAIGNQKRTTEEDEERLRVDQDRQEGKEVEDQYEVGREDTSEGDSDNNSNRPPNEGKSEL